MKKIQYILAGTMLVSLSLESKTPELTKAKKALDAYLKENKLDPVSYTHLDVYKRQGIYLVSELGYVILRQCTQERKR